MSGASPLSSMEVILLRRLWGILYSVRVIAGFAAALSGWFCWAIGLFIAALGDHEWSTFCLLLGTFSMANAAYIRPSDPPHILPDAPAETVKETVVPSEASTGG